jgi:hypothetical protein
MLNPWRMAKFIHQDSVERQIFGKFKGSNFNELAAFGVDFCSDSTVIYTNPAGNPHVSPSCTSARRAWPSQEPSRRVHAIIQ